MYRVESDLLREVVDYWLGCKTVFQPEHHCTTRDIFQARLDSFLRHLINHNKNADEASLLVAVVGETGNNCFDHNLGQWTDLFGCWFGYSLMPDSISVAVADRGRGILSSLKTVELNLRNEQEAIELAFSKAVSGRFPERRGNGLKFVRRVINGDPGRGLFCQSGSGIMILGGLTGDIKREVSLKIGKEMAKGTFTYIRWNLS